jgi:2',3'-cyclic-nucleotide 2'-phosphodiesterase
MHSTPATPNKATFDILFFGDVIGKPGREGVYHYLKHHLEYIPDMLIANVENLTHGFGTSEKHYQEMIQHGFHAMTGGNHSFDRKESLQFIGTADRLVRPANIPGKHVPGKGGRIIDVDGQKVGVLNILGQVFMANYNSPWEALERELPPLLNETPIVFVDMHAEATAEKACLARMAAEMGASAVVGTHTHVQTNDARILHDRTGFLTDAGMNGAYESIIGMDAIAAQKRMMEQGHVRLEVAESSTIQINAVCFSIDRFSGQCLHVQPVFQIIQLPLKEAAASNPI